LGNYLPTVQLCYPLQNEDTPYNKSLRTGVDIEVVYVLAVLFMYFHINMCEMTRVGDQSSV